MSLAAPTLTIANGPPPVLSWTAVAACRGYAIFRDGVILDTVGRSTLSYADGTEAAGTAHSYSVLALSVGEPKSGSQSSSAHSNSVTPLLVGVRTALTLQPSKIATGYVYGAEGKLIGDGATIDAGGAHLAGLYGQLSLAGAVVTSGHVAAVIADVQTPPDTGANLVDGIYVEQVVGSPINSILKAIANATYAFDLHIGPGVTSFAPAAGTGSTSAGAATGVAAKVLKVLIDGTVYYIPLFAANG